MQEGRLDWIGFPDHDRTRVFLSALDVVSEATCSSN